MSSLEKTVVFCFVLFCFFSAQSCDKSEAATTCYSHVLKYFEAINYYYYYSMFGSLNAISATPLTDWETQIMTLMEVYMAVKE